MAEHLEEILEEIKQMGHYAVSAFFGEDIGCDDLDVSLDERRLQVRAVPVGYLGEIRRIWVGTFAELKAADLAAVPTRLSNPPAKLPEEPGVYAWGTDSSMDDFMAKLAAGA
jgi:hypothetical protein